MGDPRGFLKVTERETAKRRLIEVRIKDWKEVYEPTDPAVLKNQAGRCMDCGIAFCHHGCPLGNLIPEWNDLTWRQDGKSAIERLHATNNLDVLPWSHAKSDKELYQIKQQEMDKSKRSKSALFSVKKRFL